MPKVLVYIPPQGVACIFETAQPTVIYIIEKEQQFISTASMSSEILMISNDTQLKI